MSTAGTLARAPTAPARAPSARQQRRITATVDGDERTGKKAEEPRGVPGVALGGRRAALSGGLSMAFAAAATLIVPAPASANIPRAQGGGANDCDPVCGILKDGDKKSQAMEKKMASSGRDTQRNTFPLRWSFNKQPGVRLRLSLTAWSRVVSLLGSLAVDCQRPTLQIMPSTSSRPLQTPVSCLKWHPMKRRTMTD